MRGSGSGGDQLEVVRQMGIDWFSDDDDDDERELTRVGGYDVLITRLKWLLDNEWWDGYDDLWVGIVGGG